MQPAVVNADGSGFRLLRRAPAVPETWAPDGRHFAYTRLAANGRGSVWVATIDGAENRRLGFGAFPSWSPDGRYIASMTTGESEGALWLRDARTGKPLRRLSRRCGPSDWSPDSRRIVCADVDYSRDLFVLDVTGRRQRQRIATRGEIFSAQWAPDGRRIAFVATQEFSDDNEQATIWTVTPRGLAPKRVFTSRPAPLELLDYGIGLAWQPKPTARSAGA